MTMSVNGEARLGHLSVQHIFECLDHVRLRNVQEARSQCRAEAAGKMYGRCKMMCAKRLSICLVSSY